MENMAIRKDPSSAHHIITGKKGESLASEWLEERGFEIIEKNWRYKRFEVDIIASRHGILHFIEVKTKSSLRGGFPEEQVTIAKIRRLVNASIPYRSMFPVWNRVQFDVLAITLASNVLEPNNIENTKRQRQGTGRQLPSNTIEYFFIEDVYT